MASLTREVQAPDFSALDFQRLWSGRAKTTAVESVVLEDALSHADFARVLEIGPGEGRLTPFVRRRANEYVALDVTRTFLDRLDPRWTAPPRAFRTAANLYRLPFAGRSFSCVVMVRVYNFLAEPEAALGEIARVLAPGGSLVLSYGPKPSLATLVEDVRTFLAGREHPFHSETFSSEDLVAVRPSSFPTWAPTRRRFLRTLAGAGLRLEREFGTGLEDYRPFKQLPAGVFPPLATVFGSTAEGVFPTRFVVLRRPGESGSAEPLMPIAESVVCPRCADVSAPVDLLARWERDCPRCGFVLRYHEGLLDAVVAGEGPREIRPGATP